MGLDVASLRNLAKRGAVPHLPNPSIASVPVSQVARQVQQRLPTTIAGNIFARTRWIDLVPPRYRSRLLAQKAEMICNLSRAHGMWCRYIFRRLAGVAQPPPPIAPPPEIVEILKVIGVENLPRDLLDLLKRYGIELISSVRQEEVAREIARRLKKLVDLVQEKKVDERELRKAIESVRKVLGTAPVSVEKLARVLERMKPATDARKLRAVIRAISGRQSTERVVNEILKIFRRAETAGMKQVKQVLRELATKHVVATQRREEGEKSAAQKYVEQRLAKLMGRR